ncbi:TadE family type IV pilus minor pilin [Rathayibacter oskolensis]|uniref:TadE family type IV pilus minor pilin n=1 Tax=Rathayibacter oskolensis TaxID=1891671 RepID=UPI001FCA5D9A|nr:TadE family type IV pilus minor pilin [Rathayibacter oskolensis]
MALPAVVVVLALCLGSVAATAQYVRLVDAAADGARSAARGDDAARPVARVDAGASVAVAEEGDLVCVSVGASLRPLPAVALPVTIRSCALGGGG